MCINGEFKFILDDRDCAQLKFTEKEGLIFLDLVMVPVKYRGSGIGSGLIRRLLLLADSLNKEVRTTARPIGPNSEERVQRLVKYYERFGFQPYEKGVSVMKMRRKAELTL